MLGDGDASVDMIAKLKNVQDSYQKLKYKVSILVFQFLFYSF